MTRLRLTARVLNGIISATSRALSDAIDDDDERVAIEAADAWAKQMRDERGRAAGLRMAAKTLNR